MKVNFNQNLLVGVNVNGSWLCEATSLLNCNIGWLPFVYLGLPIDGDAQRLSFWELLLTLNKVRIAKLKKYTFTWMVVMSSLHVYDLS